MNPSENETPIKACLFDAYGTLFDVHAPVEALAARIGPNAAAMSALWRQKQLQYTWLRSLMNAYTGFETLTAEALDHALAVYDVGDDGLRRDLLAKYRCLDAYPDVPDCLQHLQDQGLKTGILSNGESDAVIAAARSADIATQLDPILSAETVQIFKPHSAVYQLAPDTLALAPAQICFVSANAWDVAGAAHFGFHVIWLNRFSQTAEALPGSPKAAIPTLGALPAALGLT